MPEPWVLYSPPPYDGTSAVPLGHLVRSEEIIHVSIGSLGSPSVLLLLVVRQKALEVCKESLHIG